MYSYVSLPEGRFPKRQMCQLENKPNHQRRKFRIFRALLGTFLCSATFCQPLVRAKPARYPNAVGDFGKAKLSWTCWSYLKTTTLYQGQEVAFGDLTHPPLVHPIIHLLQWAKIHHPLRPLLPGLCMRMWGCGVQNHGWSYCVVITIII